VFVENRNDGGKDEVPRTVCDNRYSQPFFNHNLLKFVLANQSTLKSHIF
jgi:hypothetical protein